MPIIQGRATLDSSQKICLSVDQMDASPALYAGKIIEAILWQPHVVNAPHVLVTSGGVHNMRLP